MNFGLISHDRRVEGREWRDEGRRTHPSSLVHRPSSIAALCLMTLCSLALFPAGCTMIPTAGSRLDGESWDGMKLWYSQPAKEWSEALPVGNGSL